MEIGLDIQGLAGLAEAMKQLRDSCAEQDIWARALQKAGRPLLARARGYIHNRTGQLAKNLEARPKPAKNGYILQVGVFKQDYKGIYFAPFLEFGHRSGTRPGRKRKRRKDAKVQAKPRTIAKRPAAKPARRTRKGLGAAVSRWARKMRKTAAFKIVKATKKKALRFASRTAKKQYRRAYKKVLKTGVGKAVLDRRKQVTPRPFVGTAYRDLRESCMQILITEATYLLDQHLQRVGR